MEKKHLLLIPFFTGLAFVVYAWFLSYPLTVNSATDTVFYHIPIWYWLGFALLLTSMVSMAMCFKNTYLKWILTVGCVLTLYSLSFFYYTVPGSDAQYFRGLTQNLINTNNLDASQLNHNYYQWPSFFLLGDIVTAISGIDLTTYGFLLFALIGALLATALFVYASRFNSQIGFLATASFFIVLFYFLNYQAVPFSLAFGMLLILFMIETQNKTKNAGITVIELSLFISIALTHAFVPLFFILYLLMSGIIGKSKWHFGMFAVTGIMFLAVQFTLGQYTFLSNLFHVTFASTEYGNLAESTLVPSVSAQIDVIAQMFSRLLTVAFAAISVVGFFFVLIKRKLRNVDKAIFLTGVLYSGLGVLLYVLGSRAVPLIFLPVSLGAMYLATQKFGRYLKVMILLLLVLVVFIPVHSTFKSFPLMFQTKEDITTANAMLNNYNWTTESIVITDNGAKWYILPQLAHYIEIDTGITSRLTLENITNYDCIVYSVGLEESLQTSGNSAQPSEQIRQDMNVVYDSGRSYIAMKSR